MTALAAFPIAERLRRCSAEDCQAILATLSAPELASLAHEWRLFWARPDQLAPKGFWIYTFWKGGRGSGKTTSAANYVIERAKAGKGPIMLIGGTRDDVRSVMVEDEGSGILGCSPPDFMPEWDPSVGVAGQLTWPNGVVGLCFSAQNPARIRGKNIQTCWMDDLANWPTAKSQKVFDMTQYCLRKGIAARIVLSSTPIDNPFIISLIEDRREGMIIIESSSDDNFSCLSVTQQIIQKQFVGSELEAQERYGKLVKRSDKSPFHGIDFKAEPVRVASVRREDLVEVVIVIDPTETARPSSDECGLVAMGRDSRGHVYVLEDRSDCVEPEVWAARAIDMAEGWQASCFVAETNRGEATIRTNLNAAMMKRRLLDGQQGVGVLLPIVGVVALDRKVIRAGPVRQLYINGHLHHLPGLGKLEAQQLAWDPDGVKKPKTDDRLDAVVHGAVHLAKLDKPAKPGPPRGLMKIPGFF